MQHIESINEMQSFAMGLRTQGKLIGLAPTVSALHAGQLSLIEIARERSDVVVVSFHTNPARYAPGEDPSLYPRDVEHDLALCEEHNVDVAFTPKPEELFPEGFSTYVQEEDLSGELCGISLPRYFRGVCTEVAKLLNIVRPDVAVFGQKDAQMIAVVRKMVADLHFPVDIVVGPTIRDDRGIALGARNVRLTDFQKEDAAALFGALQTAQRMVDEGVRNVDRLKAEITHTLGQRRRLRVIYVSVVDKDTIKPLREVVPGNTLVAVAAWCDEVRLIDNVVL